MKPDCLFDFEELQEMNLPEELLILIRKTMDDVLLSRKPEKVCCDLTQILFSPKYEKILIGKKKNLQFSIYPSGLIFIEILNGVKENVNS